MTYVVIFVVSGALMIGAAWGIFWGLSKRVEGFLVAMAGGALIVSTLLELIEPATHNAPLGLALAAVMAGAVAFSVLAYLVKKKWGGDSGGGLLAAM